MKIQGKIKAITDVVGGSNDKGDWAKRSIVIDVDAEYPFDMVFDLFKNGENVKYVKENFNFENSDNVEIDYTPRANEYQGKWYGSNSIFRIEKLKSSIKDVTEDLPF